MKFIAFSLFGIFMFFCPLNVGGKSIIPVDHIISFITTHLAEPAKFYILFVMYFGAALPFIKRAGRKTA